MFKIGEWRIWGWGGGGGGGIDDVKRIIAFASIFSIEYKPTSVGAKIFITPHKIRHCFPLAFVVVFKT